MMLVRASAGVVVLLASITAALAQTGIPLADVKKADPTIVVELRYAGKNNIARRALYPRRMRAMVRPELLPRLASAHKFLRQYNYRLKIWDAYRPPAAQTELWSAIQNDNYVANPALGAGSLHSWGVAVDCTLTDLHNREVQMPTDFDDFTVAAMTRYVGPDPLVRRRLRLLQVAMAGSGFYGFHNEWWHFTVKNWAKYLPPDEAERVRKIFKSPSEDKL
ncbi:MAG TPA: M15 family metallopeptidase [Chthoniobacterales bacterium]|nr:M15 family metallopeptidase [Chthoniobacterales bacterium]